jgi:maltose O-acetyltransferase
MNKWIAGRILKCCQCLRVFFYSAISTGHSTGSAQKIQPVLVLGRGVVKFEENVTLGFFPSAFFLNGYIHLEARNEASSITSYVNNNFVAVAEHTAIRIGKRCLVGTNVEIIDSDFHGIKVLDRLVSCPQDSRPVNIGDDVFIGSNVKILKGVSIGHGSVIANGSIVVGLIPSNVIAGGNPAKVLRVIENER